MRIPEADLRGLYETLWDLSDLPGAISTAPLLMDEAGKDARYWQSVELNVAQGNVLRQATRIANPAY